MKYIHYLYPKYNKVSFHFISRQHIRYLRQKLTKDVYLVEGDVNSFDPAMWGANRNIILHPLFYPFFEGVTADAHLKLGKIYQCISRGYRIVAFDTADSDRLSDKAVELTKVAEALIVPSEFARKAFENSGVTRPVHVIPHGVPDEFITKDRSITHPDLLKLKKLKESKRLLFVHFNISHSGFRKGADLFAKAMHIVQKEKPNVVVLVKRLEGEDPYLGLIRTLRCIEIAAYLDLHEYRQLYDLSDVTVLTSRGGGFEHIAIESLARGIPTIVPKAGCFLDYIKYTIPVDVTDRKPVVLPDNPIHVGRGWEVDVEKLAETILKVTDNLKKYRNRAMKNMPKIWKEYSWRRIVDIITDVLEQYDFI